MGQNHKSRKCVPSLGLNCISQYPELLLLAHYGTVPISGSWVLMWRFCCNRRVLIDETSSPRLLWQERYCCLGFVLAKQGLLLHKTSFFYSIKLASFSVFHLFKFGALPKAFPKILLCCVCVCVYAVCTALLLIQECSGLQVAASMQHWAPFDTWRQHSLSHSTQLQAAGAATLGVTGKDALASSRWNKHHRIDCPVLIEQAILLFLWQNSSKSCLQLSC